MENISPLAKMLAEQNGIDWTTLKGTGAGGQVVEEDIINYLTMVMSGDAEPPSTPVDVPPPDWDGTDPTASLAMAHSDMLGQHGIDEADLAAIAAPTSDSAPAPATVEDDDDLELDEEPVAPAAPEVPSFTQPEPVAPAASFGGLGGFSEPVTPAAPEVPSFAQPEVPSFAQPEPVAPAASFGGLGGFSELVAPAASFGGLGGFSEPVAPAAPEVPSFAQPEPEVHVSPEPVSLPEPVTPAAPEVPSFAQPEPEVHVSPEPVSLPEPVAPAAPEMPSFAQPAAAAMGTAAVAAAVAAAATATASDKPAPVVEVAPMPANLPSNTLWMGVHMRRTVNLEKVSEIREQLGLVLGQDVPLSLLIARAARIHADKIGGLSGIAIHDAYNQRARAVGALGATLRESVAAIDTDHEGEAQLLVVNAGTFDLDELHFPESLTLSIGRVDENGDAVLSLNGELREVPAASEFLVAVAESLLAPIGLIV